MSDLDDIQNPHVAERVDEDLYGSESEEVILKNTPVMSQATITRSDLQDIINGWEEKFDKLAEGVRAIEEGTHETNSTNWPRVCAPSKKAHTTSTRTWTWS